MKIWRALGLSAPIIGIRRLPSSRFIESIIATPQAESASADFVFGSCPKRTSAPQNTFRPLANAWAVYDNSGERPRLLETGP
jgi:hypothetical protein